MQTKWYLRLAIISGFCFALLGSGLQFTAAQEEQSAPSPLTPIIRFAHLTSDDGLAQNSVEAILQDRQGFMWFGTVDGISRYDGYRFVTYRNNPEDRNSLSQNHVRDLFEDKDGMIWIATEGGGVNRFDPRTETFQRYAPDFKKPNGLAGDRVLHIFQDSHDYLWFTGGGLTALNRFNPTTQEFSHYPIPDGFMPSDMVEDKSGTIWVVGGSAIGRYKPDSKSVDYFDAPSVNGKRENQLNSIALDQNGNIWLGGSNGLYQLYGNKVEFKPYLNFEMIRDILRDEDGGLWIAAGEGLVKFDPLTKAIVQEYKHDAYQSDSISSTRKLRLYRDRTGHIWIGTDGAGVDMLDPHQSQFSFYRHDPNTATSLADGPISSFSEGGDGRLWVGVGGVLELLDTKTNEISHYPINASDGQFFGNISAVYEDHTGTVWVGASGLRIYQFDMNTSQFTPYPLQLRSNRPGPPKMILKFFEDKSQNLWIVMNQDGLYKLDVTRKQLDFFEQPPNEPPPDAPKGKLPPAFPPSNDLIVDRTGNFWISTVNGIQRFDPNTGTYEQYRLRTDGRGADSWTESILEDTKGMIWVTSQDGLVKFDPRTKTSQFYTERDGLPTNLVVGILEDKQGYLWLSTKKGLSRFSPETEIFRNYDVSDGLQGNDFNERAFIQTSNGQFFFGGTNGLTAFYPDQITDRPYQQTVVLTDFQLFNKPVELSQNSVLKQAIWSTSGLTLNYDQNIASFEFAGLSYSAPKKVHYRYQLTGFDKDWNVTDSTRRFVTYTNLPAGDYVFRVQAENDNGTWSEQEVSLALTILPPWWETMWFRVLALVGAAAVVYGGYLWRIRSIARRNRDLELEVSKKTSALQAQTQALQNREEQLRHAKEAAESANRAKSAFLASMSHELRSPLNVILGFTQVAHRDRTLANDVRENLGIVLRSGEHLLALINQVLDLSKIEAGHMTLSEVDFDIYRLIDDLEDMFILKADEKRLQLIFEHSSDLPRYIHGDSVKLRQILINLISNALKFTQQGGITLRVRQINPDRESTRIQLEFEVEDTGAGIAANELSQLFEAFSQTSTGKQHQEGTGLGLAISKRFIRLMGGDISVKSEVGRGTTFTFQIQCTTAASAEQSEYSIQRRIIGLEPGQAQYRILVVDDKWVNRQLLMKLLSPLGFELREAENGQEAIDIAHVFQPHIVWMDMRMPVLNGLDATREIKSIEPSTTVIALTASAFDEERSDILAAGCDDFLRKPFRSDDIFDMISKHLGIRYVYSGDKANISTLEAETIQPEVLKGAVFSLPTALQTRLTEGVELGDNTMLENVITEIEKLDPKLAKSLHTLVSRFEYDKLLDVIKETVDEPL